MNNLKKMIYIGIIILTMSGCSKTEIIKDTIIREKDVILDYSSSISLEKAINNDESVIGKNAKLIIKKIDNQNDENIISSGKKITFIYNGSEEIRINDYIVIKIIKEPIIENDKYLIEYELIKIINNKENTNTNEEKTENNNNNASKLIVENSSSSYTEKLKDEIEKEFKNKGFKNKKIIEIETNDKNNKAGTVTSISIDGKVFNKGDSFDVEKEVIIYYWKYVEEQKENESSELAPEGIVLPKENSKLAKDFESKGLSTIYYMNVDGKSNKPTIKKWDKATVTDGVAEYLDYLKELDYNIEITDVTNKEPYSGFHTYESKYKVTKGTINWTMYHLIQDEKYVEYQFDIYFKK